MMDWDEQLAKATANGREYAESAINGGQLNPADSPLSGEWAGAPTPRDVVDMACGPQVYPITQDWAIEELCDAWEEGYRSAEWPGFQPGGFHPGDQVEYVVHGEWTGPYEVTDGEGRSPQHLVLRGRSGVFEHYNDAPFNTRLYRSTDSTDGAQS